VTYVEYYLLYQGVTIEYVLFTVTLPPDRIGIFKFVPNIFRVREAVPARDLDTRRPPKAGTPITLYLYRHSLELELESGTWN
jgi:hypothetical protein